MFEPYIQYVEIRLLGCAIRRHRVLIPKSIQGLAPDNEIGNRLRTTFDLFEKGSAASSKALESELEQIRDELTRPLGKPWGRVLLRAVRERLDERLAQLQERLDAHKNSVEESLAEHLNSLCDQIVNYYTPLINGKPPDALLGQLMTSNPTDQQIRDWLRAEVSNAFPKTDGLVDDMRLEVQFRDVIYETLNEDGFAKALRKAFQSAAQVHRTAQPAAGQEFDGAFALVGDGLDLIARYPLGDVGELDLETLTPPASAGLGASRQESDPCRIALEPDLCVGVEHGPHEHPASHSC